MVHQSMFGLFLGFSPVNWILPFITGRLIVRCTLVAMVTTSEFCSSVFWPASVDRSGLVVMTAMLKIKAIHDNFSWMLNHIRQFFQEGSIKSFKKLGNIRESKTKVSEFLRTSVHRSGLQCNL